MVASLLYLTTPPSHPHRPLVLKRTVATFDLSLLADFRERPQLQHVVMCERIQPLVTCPGSVMITDKTFYFQPAAINNIGERVQRCARCVSPVPCGPQGRRVTPLSSCSRVCAMLCPSASPCARLREY